MKKIILVLILLILICGCNPKDKCKTDSDCLATCYFGCVNKYWMEKNIDCTIDPLHSCKCENGLCTKIFKNCEQACEYEGYKRGECKYISVIEDPCSVYGEFIQVNFECEQNLQENLIDEKYICCCK